MGQRLSCTQCGSRQVERLPAAEGGDSDVGTLSRRGYNLAHWTAAGLNFWAVSDLNADELREFARLVRDSAP